MLFAINASSLARQLKTSSTQEVIKDLITLTTESLATLGVTYRERIFTPFVTLYLLLSQVFNDDSTCRRAVLELSNIRKAGRKKPCSTATGSFCKAKKRLSLAVIQALVRHLAARLTAKDEKAWAHGRVFVVDGTCFSMPDTKANAAAFVRNGTANHKNIKKRKSGRDIVAFPVGRILGFFSLTTGAVIDIALSTWKGKGTGEQSLLQELWTNVKKDDTLLGDAVFSSFFIFASALKRNCHVVSELRKSSHHRLKSKLNDQIIKITKPKYVSSCSVSKDDYDSMVEEITLRVVKVTCAPAGFRPKTKFVITTHLDKNVVTAEELSDLYRNRWQVELNFRSIKTVLGMDIVRGKSPDMVRKEVWIHMLAYNLIRQKMIEVALKKKQSVASVSFRATQQAMAIARLLRACGVKINDSDLTAGLLSEQVGGRPNRYEPRAIKRRQKGYKLLTESRKVAKTKLHKKYKKRKQP